MRRRVVPADRVIETRGDDFVAAHEDCADGHFAGSACFFGGGLRQRHEAAIALRDFGNSGKYGRLAKRGI
jgi:hypothetical protein